MKLGLLGYPIEHSLSPALYRKLLAHELESYELFSFKTPAEIPPLEFFSTQLDGLNITSPYKQHFLGRVTIPDQNIAALGAVNTLAFRGAKTFATNTDYLAVVEILKNYQAKYKDLQLLLLGDGVMAGLTKSIAATAGYPLVQFSRKLHHDLSLIDLTPYARPGIQTIIINSCSRDFVFNGRVNGSEIFWDYNYAFSPHEDHLPGKVKLYCDGQEMLELQARAAIKFWKSNH